MGLTNEQIRNFDEWWDSNHCEGEGPELRRENAESYSWARAAYNMGLDDAEQVSPETPDKTVEGLTRQAVLLTERAELAERLAADRGEALMNMRKKQHAGGQLDDSMREEMARVDAENTTLREAIKLLAEVL